MKSKGSMPNSQGLSNNTCPEPNQLFLVLTHISIISFVISYSNVHLGIPRGLFCVGFQLKFGVYYNNYKKSEEFISESVLYKYN